MTDTTYEIDGITYEAIVSDSWTIDVINRWDAASSALRGELTKATKYSVEQAIKDAPLGLADVSILRRWNKEQAAYAVAMENYITSNFPKIAKRIYQPKKLLWNFCMNCTICAFDQMEDHFKEKLEGIDGRTRTSKKESAR